VRKGLLNKIIWLYLKKKTNTSYFEKTQARVKFTAYKKKRAHDWPA
jgi:hypothetical protein